MPKELGSLFDSITKFRLSITASPKLSGSAIATAEGSPIDFMLNHDSTSNFLMQGRADAKGITLKAQLQKSKSKTLLGSEMLQVFEVLGYNPKRKKKVSKFTVIAYFPAWNQYEDPNDIPKLDWE